MQLSKIISDKFRPNLEQKAEKLVNVVEINGHQADFSF